MIAIFFKRNYLSNIDGKFSVIDVGFMNSNDGADDTIDEYEASSEEIVILINNIN